MDVAVVGCGAVARRYVSGLAAVDGLRLVGVADRDPDRAGALAAEVGCTAYPGVDPLLAGADPDVVVVLTDHAAHASVTRACLDAGVHVFSEKPLAGSTEEARALLELAESRGLGLACAPVNHRGEQQRLAADRIADGSLGEVRVVTAWAHVGRVTEWHDRPGSFLAVGPLADGGVYPLTLLVEWFGPVVRVRTADATTPYPAREGVDPASPTHVEATLRLRAGPLLRLTASYYVPHRTREFYGVEVHGDDGSLSLADAGDLGGDRAPLVSVARAGRGYTPVPLQRPPDATPLAAGPAALVEAVRRGRAGTASARRGAHVVAVVDAVERAAASGGPVAVESFGFSPTGRPPVRNRPAAGIDHGPSGNRRAAIRLPPIGFGCSGYRDGSYVDRRSSIETALDAGYRLLDSAELYGNEGTIGELLAAPGSPDREALFVASKVWNTNHGHVREACETTCRELGVDALDCYLLHWPDSWAYTGPLVDLASLSAEEREARTFPRGAAGEIRPGTATLEDAWRGLERVHAAGLARTVGVCNVDRETLAEIRSFAEVPPAVVQVERHPYRPRSALVERCHELGIRVIAHSPLSAPGLLAEPTLADIAAEHEATPAQVVLAWNVAAGVVPIPSSVDPDHVVENAAAAGIRLGPADRARIDALADPGFER